MVQVDDIPPEQHALVPSFMGANSGGKRIHPLPFSDPAFPGNRYVLSLVQLVNYPTLRFIYLFLLA